MSEATVISPELTGFLTEINNFVLVTSSFLPIQCGKILNLTIGVAPAQQN